MSLSTQTLKRIATIKQSLRKGLNREQIGLKCGVTEKTIDRDMKAWVQSGLFEIWLKEEFVDLHNYVRDSDPVEAYRQISKIVSKMVTHKIEAKTEATVEIKQELSINYDELSEDERDLCRKITRRYIKRNNQERPTTIH